MVDLIIILAILLAALCAILVILKMCNHEWETVKKLDIVRGSTKIGTEYHQRCKKCGKLKMQKFI